ncbi:hypothetical protein Poli38472_005672 [Pythium oligandrum]|uniref:Peroxin/Ferlin domain-containing protein n=1 Tax=Pythium oligandrum TaxID=41045 RepID=A0A8K1CGE6_PYTOL|nr:hypothetical protein Poli38472_005672 [Pythium oligandrum]|eukprot:TMW63054.1 hypothetical protein Poli38472_005672 [Pythium oligandrum]
MTKTLCAEEDCTKLRRDVEALERLVYRYQAELSNNKPCSTCQRRKKPALESVVEELYEDQKLNTTEWNAGLAQMTRLNGEPTSFEEVTLPSKEWEWVGGWTYDIDSKTDMNGWTYASTWTQLRDPELCNSERTVQDRVRRRHWKRERQHRGPRRQVGVSPNSVRDDSDAQAMRIANEKLTEQLRQSNERILDYESRIAIYEDQLRRLQGLAHATPSSIGPFSLPPVSKDSVVIMERAPYSAAKSVDVLYETEALLDELLEDDPSLSDIEDMQQRRSRVVQECQEELDSAVIEFQALVSTMDE